MPADPTTRNNPVNTLPPPPKWALALAGLASLALGVLALLRGFQGATSSPILPFTVLFDALGLLAAIFGALAAIGRFNVGPAMALASVGGVSIIAAALGFDTANKGGFSAIPRDPMVLARVGLSGAILALAATIVLVRQPKESFKRVILGAMLLGVGVMLGAMWTLPALRGWLQSSSVLGVASAVVALIATATIAIGLVSAGGHNLIRAFEFGSAKDAPAAPQIK